MYNVFIQPSSATRCVRFVNSGVAAPRSRFPLLTFMWTISNMLNKLFLA